jgi:hypothetical protein
LSKWFPAAHEARILTPLVPALDSGRKVIGFYRFLLPAPRPDGPPAPRVPARPLGWRTVRWLVDDDETRRLLQDGGSRATQVDYPPVTRRDISRHGCRVRVPSAREVDRVDIRVTHGLETFRIIAYHDKRPRDAQAPEAGRPLCMVAESSEGIPFRPLSELIARRLGLPGD